MRFANLPRKNRLNSSFLWAQMDSNHRRRKPADLQSAPFGHSGICPSLRASCRSGFFAYPPIVSFRASCRIRTNDPEITNHVLWPTELKRRTPFRTEHPCETGANLDIIFEMTKKSEDFFQTISAFPCIWRFGAPKPPVL